MERDWAYLVKREYNYEVLLKAIGYGFFAGNIAWSARQFMLKRFVIWPLPVVGLLTALYLKPIYFQRVNKRLFDMCNVGEQYCLGTPEGSTLAKCI